MNNSRLEAFSDGVIAIIITIMVLELKVLYLVGIAAAYGSPRLSQGIYLLVVAMWLVPDRRIENVLACDKTKLHSCDRRAGFQMMCLAVNASMSAADIPSFSPSTSRV